MSVFREVHDLIERFDRHVSAYRSGHYNETQLRRECLDSFFEALGWDINKRQGHAGSLQGRLKMKAKTSADRTMIQRQNQRDGSVGRPARLRVV
ncbi:MAG: hypothetical protein H0T45_10130 [Pyrinomonadaceae bacterium]|nr:hypothetical protein [Pyrinomonadaceae bacterium]MDQ3258308.1 hypothetical protein [Acidobacteriota bacterium]